MKKLLAFLLIAFMAFSVTACGTVNDSDVAVIWKEGDTAIIPGSLIDTMERAMYIENIAYTHLDSEGDSKKQYSNAEKAVNEGAAALLVNLIEVNDAEKYITLAKGKNIPVVFFGCDIDTTVLETYEKAACVSTDDASLVSVQGAQIKDYMASKYDNEKDTNSLDKNNDGVFSCIALGNVDDVIAESECDLELIDSSELLKAEIIITDNEKDALEALEALQKEGYNKDKLVTHYVPIFTVGSDADASRFTDTSKMADEDMTTFVYTVSDIIGEGKMTGTVIEDRDSIAGAAVKVVGNLLKGKEIFEGIAEENLAGKNTVKISYIAVG